MKKDFFKKTCQEKTKEKQFGLIDLQDGTAASINIDRQAKAEWIAIVNNDNQAEITFTAIDNCIPIYRPNGDLESRCDRMLTHANNIDFVELKAVRQGWIEGGIE